MRMGRQKIDHSIRPKLALDTVYVAPSTLDKPGRVLPGEACICMDALRKA